MARLVVRCGGGDDTVRARQQQILHASRPGQSPALLHLTRPSLSTHSLSSPAETAYHKKS